MNMDNVTSMAWDFIITYKWWFFALCPFVIGYIVLKIASPR